MYEKIALNIMIMVFCIVSMLKIRQLNKKNLLLVTSAIIIVLVSSASCFAYYGVSGINSIFSSSDNISKSGDSQDTSSGSQINGNSPETVAKSKATPSPENKTNTSKKTSTTGSSPASTTASGGATGSSSGTSTSSQPATTPNSSPSPSSGMPNRANTGPRYALSDMTPSQFYSSRSCSRQRINGDVQINQVSMRGQTFSLTDCEITGNLSFYLIGGDQQLPADQMPTINVNYTDILGGINSQHAVKLNVDHSYIYNRVQMKLTDGWPIVTPGYAPYTFTNSLLYNPYQTQPTHTETLQTAGYGTGTSFSNVVFMQQGGPLNNTGVTAVVNYVGNGTVFDGCYFIWDGEVPAWYTVYISGPGVIVRNSWFDAAAGGYVYPVGLNVATFINNKNYRTNQAINLP